MDDVCRRFNEALNTCGSPEEARRIVAGARAAGCHVKADADRAIAEWAAQLEREHAGQGDPGRGLGTLFDGIAALIQMQGSAGGLDPRSAPSLPGLPGPAVPQPADPANRSGSTTGPASGSGSDCREVCVEWVTEWLSSDGRHQTCCPNGRPNPSCVDVTCTSSRRCARWEIRCGG
jgi:hypothetical protein